MEELGKGQEVGYFVLSTNRNESISFPLSVGAVGHSTVWFDVDLALADSIDTQKNFPTVQLLVDMGTFVLL